MVTSGSAAGSPYWVTRSTETSSRSRSCNRTRAGWAWSRMRASTSVSSSPKCLRILSRTWSRSRATGGASVSRTGREGRSMDAIHPVSSLVAAGSRRHEMNPTLLDDPVTGPKAVSTSGRARRWAPASRSTCRPSGDVPRTSESMPSASRTHPSTQTVWSSTAISDSTFSPSGWSRPGGGAGACSRRASRIMRRSLASEIPPGRSRCGAARATMKSRRRTRVSASSPARSSRRIVRRSVSAWSPSSPGGSRTVAVCCSPACS